MNILVEDRKGVWWRFTGVKDRTFEVVWAGEQYQVGFSSFAVAVTPLIYGQSGQKVICVECDRETCGHLSAKVDNA